MPKFTDAKGVSQHFAVLSVHTLRYWRKVGIGPPAYKVNGRVLYDLDEVEGWLRSHLDAPTAS